MRLLAFLRKSGNCSPSNLLSVQDLLADLCSSKPSRVIRAARIPVNVPSWRSACNPLAYGARHCMWRAPRFGERLRSLASRDFFRRVSPGLWRGRGPGFATAPSSRHNRQSHTAVGFENPRLPRGRYPPDANATIPRKSRAAVTRRRNYDEDLSLPVRSEPRFLPPSRGRSCFRSPRVWRERMHSVPPSGHAATAWAIGQNRVPSAHALRYFRAGRDPSAVEHIRACGAGASHGREEIWISKKRTRPSSGRV